MQIFDATSNLRYAGVLISP